MTDAELAETMAWYKTLPPLGNGPRNADKDFWREMDAMQLVAKPAKEVEE